MYVVVKNFMDGKNKDGSPKILKKGDHYDGARAKEFLEKGNLKKAEDINLEELNAVEKKIEAAKAELAALQAKSAKFKRSEPAPLAAPSAKEESGKKDEKKGK